MPAQVRLDLIQRGIREQGVELREELRLSVIDSAARLRVRIGNVFRQRKCVSSFAKFATSVGWFRF